MVVARRPRTGGTELYADMELWAEVLRRVLVDELSKREACRRYAIHWLTLLSHAEPPGYRRVKPPRRPTIASVLPIIRQILDADAQAPRKQRHTAKRSWERLKAEHGFRGREASKRAPTSCGPPARLQGVTL
jgi:hypothetical protein